MIPIFITGSMNYGYSGNIKLEICRVVIYLVALIYALRIIYYDGIKPKITRYILDRSLKRIHKLQIDKYKNFIKRGLKWF